MGKSLPQTLDELSGRVPLKEMRWFVAAVQITQSTGGSMADVLETLSTTLQEQQTLREHIHGKGERDELLVKREPERERREEGREAGNLQGSGTDGRRHTEHKREIGELTNETRAQGEATFPRSIRGEFTRSIIHTGKRLNKKGGVLMTLRI